MATYVFARQSNGNIKCTFNGNIRYIPGDGWSVDPTETSIIISKSGEKTIEFITSGNTIQDASGTLTGTPAEIAEGLTASTFFKSSSGGGGGGGDATFGNLTVTGTLSVGGGELACLSSEVTITDAQFKDLIANPIEILPAPPAGKAYFFTSYAYVVGDMSAGAYIAGDYNIQYTFDGTPSGIFVAGASLDYENASLQRDSSLLIGKISTGPVAIANTGGDDMSGGNAANKIYIKIIYTIVPATP